MPNCLEELVYYNVFSDEFMSKTVKFIQCTALNKSVLNKINRVFSDHLQNPHTSLFLFV